MSMSHTQMPTGVISRHHAICNLTLPLICRTSIPMNEDLLAFEAVRQQRIQLLTTRPKVPPSDRQEQSW